MANLDLSFSSTAFPRALEVRQRLYDSGVLGQSTRYRTLDRLHAFAVCAEYDHLEHSWSGYKADACEAISPAAVLPFGFVQQAGDLRLHQKRPSAPLRLAPTVIERFTDLLFGEDSRPKMIVEDDEVADDFVQAAIKKSNFFTVMSLARSLGGAMGSAFVTVQLRPDLHRKIGRFVFKAHDPKTVQDVVWEDEDSRRPLGVLVQYVFFREVERFDEKTGRPTGQTKQTPFLYRRILDEEMDVVFVPAEIVGTQLPDLRIDEERSYRHGLGRFPGVWIQNLPSTEDMDGVPDCDGAYQLFQTIDQQVSQSNKALLANQDPTLIVSQDPKAAKMGEPLRKGSDNALYVGAGGAASYLEMSAAAQVQASAFVKDLKQAAMDRCSVVLPDPSTIATAATSAAALRLLFKPMINKASRLREQYGPAMEELIELLLLLARTWKKPTQYPGRADPQFDLPPRVVSVDPDPMNPDVAPTKTAIARDPGVGQIVTATWGEFFSPTPGDVQVIIGTLASAVSANLVDLDTAVGFAARAYGIDDVEGLKQRVLEQVNAIQAKQDALQDAMGALYPSSVPQEVPDVGAGERPLG